VKQRTVPCSRIPEWSEKIKINFPVEVFPYTEKEINNPIVRSNLNSHLATRNLNNLTSQIFYSIIFLSSHPEHKIYNLIIILCLGNLGKNNPKLIRKIGAKL